jgi:hypothetical protein
MPATILQDSTRSRDPSSPHAFPEMKDEADLRAPRTLAEELLAGFHARGAGPERSFGLASHGGYARTVTGTVEFLDAEAQTFMVRDADGGLIRVPLRDVTSAHVTTERTSTS